MVDWTAIQAEYDTGRYSLAALSAKHDIPKTTLFRHLDTSGTERNGTAGMERPPFIRMVNRELPSPGNAIEGANLGIDSLVTYMQANRLLMDPTEHSKAAQALTLYNRILINSPTDEQAGPDEAREDFSSFSDDELAIYAELQERARKRGA